MNYVIIAAAGSGTRMKVKKNKVFLEINKIPMICRTILTFEKSKKIDGVLLVTRKNDIENLNKLVREYNFRKIIGIISGGKERQDSVFEGLKFLKNRDAKKNDIVLVHNGANPFVDEILINNVIVAIKKHGAAICGFKARDTIKEIKNEFVVRTLDRDYLWQIQTPQGARFADLFKAHQRAHQDGFFGTDDAMLLERAGHKVKMVACDEKNIKITYPEDIKIINNEITKL